MISRLNHINVNIKVLERAVHKKQHRSLMLAGTLMFLTNGSGNFGWDEETKQVVSGYLHIKPRSLQKWFDYALRDGYIRPTGKPGRYNVASLSNPDHKKRRGDKNNVRMSYTDISNVGPHYLSLRISSMQADNYNTVARKLNLPLVSKWAFCQQPDLYASVAETLKKQGVEKEAGEIFTPSNVSLSVIAKMMGVSKAGAVLLKRQAIACGYLSAEHIVKIISCCSKEEAEALAKEYRSTHLKQPYRFTVVENELHIQCTDKIRVLNPVHWVHEDVLADERTGLREAPVIF